MSDQENAAIEFASQASQVESSAVTEQAPANVEVQAEAEKRPDEPGKKADEPGKKPDEPKPDAPEVILAKAEQARRDATTRLEKINSQHAALVRQKEAFEKRQAALIEREKAVDSVTTVPDMVSYLAKARNVTADEIWNELADEIRNGGKPSEATQAKRERDRIARENAELKRQAEEREANQSQAIVQQWGEEMDSALTSDSFATAYPKLSKIPQAILVDAIVAKVEDFRRNNSGNFPRHADLLAWFESQVPEAEPAPVVPVTEKPKAKPTALTSKDTSVPPGIRELTPQEREDEAIKWASSLE